MTSKPSEKIIDALTQLLEGFSELQEMVETDYGAQATTNDDEGESELDKEIDAAIVIEIRAAIESVMESEDYSPEEIAAVISTLTDALEEIDPDVFEDETEESEEEDEDEDYDDDDDEDEDDDLDLDEDDDEDEE